MKESTFVKCECYAHAIEVSLDEDYGIDLCMWEIGRNNGTRSFRERLRWAWNELFGKETWSDQCILSATSAEKLANVLLEAAKSLRENNTKSKEQ
jgi:hypothetical protein